MTEQLPPLPEDPDWGGVVEPVDRVALTVEEAALRRDQLSAVQAPATTATANGQGPTAPRPAQPRRRGPLDEQMEDHLVWGTQFGEVPPLMPLVADVVDRGTLVVVYGPAGSGKSFFSQDMAQAVASGQPWHGHEVHQGTVLYVAAEGARGLPQRHAAWRMHHGIGAELPVGWLRWVVNLLDQRQVDALAHMVARHRPVLVVIDTLARCMGGGNENDAVDMNRVVAAAEQVRCEGDDSTLVLLHHSGVQAGRARGSTALRAAIDDEIEVVPGNKAFTARIGKQRDHPGDGEWHFRLQPAGNSVVPVAVDARPLGKPSRVEEAALVALAQLGQAGATASAWRAATGRTESTFHRLRGRLVELGLVEVVDTGFYRIRGRQGATPESGTEWQ